MCCLCSYEDITEDDKNYVEYQTHPSLTWRPCLFEKDVVENLVTSQFTRYMERVKKTDCQAELRRLLATGPPVWVSDKVRVCEERKMRTGCEQRSDKALNIPLLAF